MTQLDGSIVYVALPHIAEDLDVGISGLQWVLTGYLLTLASLILLGGALGDRFGRRRIFLIGSVWFMLASLLCGIAPNLLVLVIARLLQGIGGALLTPGSLALIQASYRPDDRAPAVGLWSGFSGVAGALGPFLGGWVVDGPGWRWAFLLNVPLGIAVLASTRAFPESRDQHRVPGFDIIGAAVVCLGLVGVTWSLNEAADRGLERPRRAGPPRAGPRRAGLVPADRTPIATPVGAPAPLPVADVHGPQHLDVRALRGTRGRVLLRGVPTPGRRRLERAGGGLRAPARHPDDARRFRVLGTVGPTHRAEAATRRRTLPRGRRRPDARQHRRGSDVVGRAARLAGVRPRPRDLRGPADRDGDGIGGSRSRQYGVRRQQRRGPDRRACRRRRRATGRGARRGPVRHRDHGRLPNRDADHRRARRRSRPSSTWSACPDASARRRHPGRCTAPSTAPRSRPTLDVRRWEVGSRFATSFSARTA